MGRFCQFAPSIEIEDRITVDPAAMSKGNSLMERLVMNGIHRLSRAFVWMSDF